jgi:hypothetical protein
MTTSNPSPPATLPVLYADEYGMSTSLYPYTITGLIPLQASTTVSASGAGTSTALLQESTSTSKEEAPCTLPSPSPLKPFHLN